MIILGIESSCDETAAALVEDGKNILSCVVASQIDTHDKYGGVVPELASRMHIEAIAPVVSEAIEKSGVGMDDIQGVAATRGPGLIGALLVGFSFAKSFAWARKLPLAGVNHLEAHIYTLFLSEKYPPFPFISLVVSGGHTNIYYVTSPDHFELLGQTRDDAAGEAFDKVSKMLSLGYPGGPVIETLAKSKDPDAIKFPRTFLEKGSFDFSFSGLKSSVARYVHDHKISEMDDKAQVAASFQEAVIDVISKKLIDAAIFKKCKDIAVTGGVAANQSLTEKLRTRAQKIGLNVFVPPKELCGDNGAMIAARGFRMIQQKNVCDLCHDVFSRARID
ncbi:MAG: tRNA (adenosine(37)-N6)-threonylcarbamoyltransferase complex transferase subunit TsaD [Desulfobacteraceae bacterium]|nr:tRNA (adenosine(37)-N6)-threonylcarbamoyltransferase complex transferase subunit TsaD [Desulfobacteraceae bacterium]